MISSMQALRFLALSTVGFVLLAGTLLWYQQIARLESEAVRVLEGPELALEAGASTKWELDLDGATADQAWMDAQVYRWYTFATVTRMMAGGEIGADSSMNKVFWSEMDVKTHETALSLIGEAQELDEYSDSAANGGHWMKGFQFALAGPIYAGTNEIQRNIIAERVLGLPRK